MQNRSGAAGRGFLGKKEGKWIAAGSRPDLAGQRWNLSTDQLAKLGERIKSLRLKAGYASYETFAYEHNLPRAQYGRYEQGKDLRFSSLVKIVSAFDLTMAEFFEDGF